MLIGVGTDSAPMECRRKRQQSVLHWIRTVTILSFMYYLNAIALLLKGLGGYMEDKKVDCILS